MTYYLIATRETVKRGEVFVVAPWSIAFGDSNRDCVIQERKDSYSGIQPIDCKIVKAKTARQSDCNAAIAVLNAL